VGRRLGRLRPVLVPALSADPHRRHGSTHRGPVRRAGADRHRADHPRRGTRPGPTGRASGSRSASGSRRRTAGPSR
jgi:hypothetical protein